MKNNNEIKPPSNDQLRLIKCICEFLRCKMPEIKTREQASKFLLENDIIADRVRDIAFR